MNLIWIAGLAILVLLEKLTEFGYWIAKGSRLIILIAGFALLVNSS